MNHDSILTTYSAVVCLILLGLGGYCLLYEEWFLPPQPALEERWVGETPFLVEPDQSVTVTYIITYDWTGTGGQRWATNGTFLEIEDRRAPANMFEVREYDGGYYTTDILDEEGNPVSNAAFAVKVYSPSGEVLNEDDGAHGRGWSIEEPGTYRIVITNLSSSEPLEIYGTFQFDRNRYYRPYARLGYVTFSLALGFIVVALIGKLRGRRKATITVPYHIFDRSMDRMIGDKQDQANVHYRGRSKVIKSKLTSGWRALSRRLLPVLLSLLWRPPQRA